MKIGQVSNRFNLVVINCIHFKTGNRTNLSRMYNFGIELSKRS